MFGKKKLLITGVLLIGLAILLILGLIRFGNILAFIWIFSSLSDSLVINSGLNPWLANIIAFVPAILFTISLWFLFSFRRKKFYTGVTMCSAGYLLTWIYMYCVTADRLYDPVSGRPNKCYAAGFNGYEEISCEWKFHPETGSPVITDRKQIDEISKSQVVASGRIKTAHAIKIGKETRLFTVDGKPLYWYYQHPDGKIELFTTPGHHPQLNTILQPITPEIGQMLLYPKNKAEADKFSFYASTAGAGAETSGLEQLRDHLKEIRNQLNN